MSSRSVHFSVNPCKNVGMENDGGAAWHQATSARVGRAVAARRKELRMTAQQLSERCRAVGAPIHRSTITKIENGRPRFDLGELIVLAAALMTSPVALLYPGPYDEEIDGLPALKSSQFDLTQWFSALDDEFSAIDTGVRDLQTARALVDGAGPAKQLKEIVNQLTEKLDALGRAVENGVPQQAKASQKIR